MYCSSIRSTLFLLHSEKLLQTKRFCNICVLDQQFKEIESSIFYVDVFSILTCVRKRDISTLFYFNYPKCVCGFRNMLLLVFNVVLCTLSYDGPSAEYINRITILYKWIQLDLLFKENKTSNGWGDRNLYVFQTSKTLEFS